MNTDDLALAAEVTRAVEAARMDVIAEQTEALRRAQWGSFWMTVICVLCFVVAASWL